MPETTQIIETLDSLFQAVIEKQNNKSYLQQWFSGISLEKWEDLLAEMKAMVAKNPTEFERQWQLFIENIHNDKEAEEYKKSWFGGTARGHFLLDIFVLILPVVLFPGGLLTGSMSVASGLAVMIMTGNGLIGAGVIMAMIVVSLLLLVLLALSVAASVSAIKDRVEYNIKVDQAIIDIPDNNRNVAQSDDVTQGVLNKVFTFFKSTATREATPLLSKAALNNVTDEIVYQL